jgi:hypothetical protein
MSEVMSLRLQGEDFTIEPRTAEKQAVGDARCSGCGLSLLAEADSRL